MKRTKPSFHHIVSSLTLILIILFSACSSPEVATPPPTPEIITVGLVPALRPLKEALQICARAYPQMALFQAEAPPGYPAISKVDLAFNLGLIDKLPAFTASIGVESIIVIVNPINPVSSFSEDEIRAIFSGRTTQWESNQSKSTIHIWIYPPDDQLWQIFSEVVLKQERVTSLANLAPDPAAMLQAVASDPSAVGYIPGSWLNSKVKAVELDQNLSISLRQPVLAMANTEPQGAARDLLYCLQSGEGHLKIEELYPLLNDK